jgi:hypothetical protein
MPTLLISLLIQVFISMAKIRKKNASLIGFEVESVNRFNIYRKRQMLSNMQINLLTFLMREGSNISLIILFATCIKLHLPHLPNDTMYIIN